MIDNSPLLIINLIALLSLAGIQGALIWKLKRFEHSQRTLMSYMLEKQEELQGKTTTLATVLKIFEDETQILKKRNEQNQLKQRFQQPRQPR